MTTETKKNLKPLTPNLAKLHARLFRLENMVVELSNAVVTLHISAAEVLAEEGFEPMSDVEAKAHGRGSAIAINSGGAKADS